MRRVLGFATAVLWAGATGMETPGQITSGEIAGRITGEGGAPVSGAVVSAEGPCLQGVHTAVTNTNGTFDLLQLPPCEQVVLTVSAAGLAPVVRRDLSVKSNTVTTLSIVMGGGDVITVKPFSPMVSTRQAETPLVLPEREIKSLPVLGEFH